MSREWKPGEVADINGSRVIRLTEGRWGWVDGVKSTDRNTASGARPLVVIDPEDTEAVERLYGAIFSAYQETHVDPVEDHDVQCMQAALREFANPTPPKPPADVAAVIADRRENTWRLLADGDWVCTSGPDVGEFLNWDRLAADRGPLEVQS